MTAPTESVPDPSVCRNCGYDLSGIDPSRCPECGIDRAGYLAKKARRARGILTTVLVVLAILIAFAAWCVHTFLRVTHDLLEAECRLQAIKVVCDVIADHAERHHPEWPGSWADLEAWSHEDPRDPIAHWDLSPSLKAEVQITFAATIEQVCSSSATSFPFLSPATGRMQYSCDTEINGLLQVLRAPRDPSGRPPPSP